MELLLMNQDFKAISVVDVLKSLIWTDRYSAYGDFEIYTPVTTELLSLLQQDYYLYLDGSEYIMIIEDLQIKGDFDEGDYLIVTGRSLESILDRRIVWGQTILTGNFQNGIQTLLNDAMIAPSVADRKIDTFVFEASIDPTITALTIDAQIARGANLYEVIQQLCSEKNIGFKVTLSDTNQLVFRLYSGTDRSYDQNTTPYVVFSSQFDNLVSADYVESKRALRNVTVVAGEGEEVARKTTVVGSGSSLTRRELYTNASDLSQKDGETALTDEEYLAQLIQRGVEDLSRCTITKSFDSQIDPVNNLFRYNEDYFMGDVIQISNNYGIESRARVTEIIHSQSDEGLNVCPTLSIIDVEEVTAEGVLIPGTGGGSTPGGSSNISDTDATDLTDGGDTTLHYHSADRNRANHTGVQAASTITQDSTHRFVTDTEKTTWGGKQDALSGDVSGHHHTSDRDRSNHTGSQLASTIINFGASVLATTLTGLSLVTGTAITAVDTVLSALGKLQKQISDHKSDTSNPHSVTATQIGLGNVTNDAQIPLTQKGAVNGVAELDTSGKVPSTQLPSYVDDVLEYADTSSFPATGESGKIYVAFDTNKTYRWGGSSYVVISDTLALGETSSTAYRGDRGKTAYDHSQITTGNPHGTSANDLGLGNVTNESKATMFTDAALTGTPTAPTALPGTNTAQIATTEFVQQEMGAAGVGDMMKSVYDTDNDGVVDNAEALIFTDGVTNYRSWFSVVGGVLTFNYEEVL